MAPPDPGSPAFEPSGIPGSATDPDTPLVNGTHARLLAAVLAAEEILVLRRVREGVLSLVPPVPRWFKRLRGVAPVRPSSVAVAGTDPPEHGPDESQPAAPNASEPFPVAEWFPYLEVHLPEAEELWRQRVAAPAGFGIWTEATNDGAEIHLDATAVRLDEGGFLLVRRADDEHAARQRVLQLARERMLDHERLLAEISAKEVLLHCIVHDLAGPLAGIQGCLEILADRTGIDTDQAEFVRMGLLQVARQQRLIRDILDVFAHPSPSDVPSTEYPATVPSHDLEACVHQVVEGLRPAFLAKHVELRIVTPPPAEPRDWRVVAEASRLERVLYNLLENALRFSPPRSTVRVSLTDHDRCCGVVVADEGPGVSPEVRPHLFQRFIRGGRNPGKSGLGLFFCRITLEPWGGSIACDDNPTGGARISVRLVKCPLQRGRPSDS